MAVGGVSKQVRKKKLKRLLFISTQFPQEPGLRGKLATEEMIHTNQMNIVKLLVSHGADLKVEDDEGRLVSPLQIELKGVDGGIGCV